ncbi:hypothetical protein V1264_015670 [Littorina saxatilis]|uniref:Uncharacterized protein n=1 Tax=Littorina saxatilis TaxID=31220 RepID=A0AAN9BMA1_9CAEN
MCTQGYYSDSVSSKACIETCSSLDNTYLNYVSSAIYGHNIRQLNGVTLQQCRGVTPATLNATCSTSRPGRNRGTGARRTRDGASTRETASRLDMLTR